VIPAKTSFRILLCALFCAAGFLGNWFKVNLFFNVEFLFGSTFALLAIVMLGRNCGIIAAFIASSCTYLLWNHPWAIVIFTGEGVVVSWLYSRRKGNLVIYDLIYWLCFGIPLAYLFYYHVMDVELESSFVVMLKQPVNGVANALMASLAHIALKLFNKNTEKTKYSDLLFTVMLSFALLPTIVLSVSAIRTYQQHTMDTLKSRVSAVSEASLNSMAGWISEYHNDIQTLSSFVGDPNSNSFENMQHYVEIIKSADPAFKGIGVFDRKSVSVSYAPLVQDGKSNLGVDMSDRMHIAVMRRDKQPFITDVLVSKLGNPAPIVILLSPIIVAGEYKGYCSGVVEVSHISGMLSNLKEQDIDITVVDGENRVIVSTIPAYKTMVRFDRPYLEAGETMDLQTRIWKAEAKPNVPVMQRWRNSYLFRMVPIGDGCRWKVIVEASLLPVARDTSQYSLTRLSLQGLLIMTAIFLSALVSSGFISNVKKLQVLTRSVPQSLDDTSRIAWPNSTVEELDELSNNFRQMTAALAKRITEQKMTEEELRHSRSQLEAALAGMADAVFISDSQGHFITFNEAFVTFHRFRSRDECLQTLTEYTDNLDVFMDNEELAPLDMWAVPRALRGETVTNAEYSLRRKDTGETWIGSYNFAPIRDNDGAIVGSVVVGRDITEKKSAEEALRKREAEFKALVENAPDVISLFDRDLRRLYVNAVIRENTGRDASFMIGITLDEAGYPDSFAQPLNAAIRNVFTTGHQETIEIDYDAPSGKIWLEIRCAPVRGADGSVLNVMTIGRNITDRKRAETELFDSYQEKTALLKEVHHRVKNNLQIVASLLGLQAGRTDNQLVVDILQNTRNRVKSMALLHETLYRSGNLARINLAIYLKDLCTQILAASGPVAARVTLDFQVAPIELPLEPALPCGLVINELVSNALKHGFPGERTGDIAVGLEAVGEKTLALSVRDGGVGLPSDFNITSMATLGMRLVSGLAAQMDGELQIMTPHGGGVVFTVIFPLPRDTNVGGGS
jgi:two-component system, cell cycle sensor histidine kinase and response regulator CckA